MSPSRRPSNAGSVSADVTRVIGGRVGGRAEELDDAGRRSSAEEPGSEGRCEGG